MSLRVHARSRDGAATRGYSGGEADPYMSRLVKLVPAEAVGVYPLLLNQATANFGPKHWTTFLVAWVALMVVIIVRYATTRVPGKGAQWGAVMIAAIAFVIWVYVMRGDFGLEPLLAQQTAAAPPGAVTRTPEAAAAIAQGFEKTSQFIANMALVFWTMVVPAVYKGDQES